MILFSAGLVALALYGWFGSWDLVTRRITSAELLEMDYQAGVYEMRQAIADYEHGRRSL